MIVNIKSSRIWATNNLEHKLPYNSLMRHQFK